MNPPEPGADPVIADLEAFRLRARSRSTLPPSGGGPTGGDLENRVAALEKSVDTIGGKLDKIIETLNEVRLGNEQRFGSIAERLASIEANLGTKASASDVAEIRGRLSSLPTTWQTITLVVGTVFSILGGSFLILKLGLPHVP